MNLFDPDEMLEAKNYFDILYDVKVSENRSSSWGSGYSSSVSSSSSSSHRSPVTTWGSTTTSTTVPYIQGYCTGTTTAPISHFSLSSSSSSLSSSSQQSSYLSSVEYLFPFKSIASYFPDSGHNCMISLRFNILDSGLILVEDLRFGWKTKTVASPRDAALSFLYGKQNKYLDEGPYEQIKDIRPGALRIHMSLLEHSISPEIEEQFEFLGVMENL